MTQAIIFVWMPADKGTQLGPGGAEKDVAWVLPRGVYTVVRDSRHEYKKIAIKVASCLVPRELSGRVQRVASDSFVTLPALDWVLNRHREGVLGWGSCMSKSKEVRL